MLFKKIPLRDDDASIYMDAYISDITQKYKRGAILVIPGGGYYEVCSGREGEPVAQAFIPKGYNAFILHYSTNRKRPFPAQLIEASKAIKHIKDNADEYGIDVNKIFVVGFSAGGHLAGSLATMWHRDEIYQEVEMPYGYNKPTGVMMIYPVVNGKEEFAHKDSFYNLLCSNTPSVEKLEECSIDKQVSENTVPIFLMHTSDDELVNVQNSLALATALAKQCKKFEMHIYPSAPHGISLAKDLSACGVKEWEDEVIANWVDQAATWAEKLSK